MTSLSERVKLFLDNHPTLSSTAQEHELLRECQKYIAKLETSQDGIAEYARGLETGEYTTRGLTECEFENANLKKRLAKLEEKLEAAIRLCAECGKGFLDIDWAIERQKLESENTRLRRDLEASDASVEALNLKLKTLAPHGTCACSYDQPGAVCLHHSPKLSRALNDLEVAETVLRGILDYTSAGNASDIRLDVQRYFDTKRKPTP